MAKIYRVALGAVLAITSALAHSQETFFAESDRDTFYLVGQRTTSFNNGPVVKSWFKIKSRYENKHHMDLIEVHCPSGQWRLTQRSTYVNGGYYTNGWTDANATWHEPTPYTVGSSFIKMCS